MLTSKLLSQCYLVVKLKSSLRIFCNRYHEMVNGYGISVTNGHGYVQFVVSTIRSLPHPWLITGIVTRVARQKLFNLPEHLHSLRMLCVVRVAQSLV